jgi:HK97 family phage major capsid protein/HK97 family phage prohead protease
MKAQLPQKIGALARDFDKGEIVVRKQDGKTSFTFPASSEEPVERWGAEEVLSHADGAIRLDRAKRGAMPLLFNHNMDDPIGLIDGARIEGGRLMVDAHLFETARGKEVATMLEGGLRNVSIGYRYHVIEEDLDNERYTATDWEPYEVSIVTVPADPTVGLGRSLGGEELEVRTVTKVVQVEQREAPASTQVSTTAQTAKVVIVENPNAAAGASAESVSALQAEQNRRSAIEKLSKAYKISAAVEARWIKDGIALEAVAEDLLKVMEERGKERPAIATELGLTGAETKRYSLFNAIRALRYGGSDKRVLEQAAFEIECSRALGTKLGRELTSNILIPAEILQRPVGHDAARAMATTPGASGGYAVNVENMGFIEILRNRSVALRMGARRISGLQGNVSFTRQTGKATVTWQGGEGTSVTASDQTLGQLTMTPKTAIAITDVSEQLLRQSSPSAEGFVMADLANDIAIDGIDNVVINGTGGAQPLGIKNTTGITSGQSASTFSYTKALAFPVAAGAVNAIRGNPGWVTNIAGAAIAMQKHLLDGTLVGFKAMSSEQLAASNLIFGSWDEVLIGEWGVLELSLDTGGTRFNQAQVGIRAMYMVDVLLRYPQAFVVSTDLSA